MSAVGPNREALEGLLDMIVARLMKMLTRSDYLVAQVIGSTSMA